MVDLDFGTLHETLHSISISCSWLFHWIQKMPAKLVCSHQPGSRPTDQDEYQTFCRIRWFAFLGLGTNACTNRALSARPRTPALKNKKRIIVYGIKVSLDLSLMASMTSSVVHQLPLSRVVRNILKNSSLVKISWIWKWIQLQFWYWKLCIH